MTRAHHKAHHNARKSTARTRNAARSCSASKPSGAGACAGPRSEHNTTRPAPDPKPAADPPMSDTLALCGLLLSTLGPHAAFEILKKVLSRACEIAVSIGLRAQPAAELAREEARTPSVRGARSSQRRRGRASRTTPSP